MANIKVSEMTEATSFDDSDYTMIVQANQNKKISKENMLGNIEDDISTINTNISSINTNIGDLTNLKTDDKTSIVDSINELKEREIYSTNEIKTNQLWTNNKPIYRKVITGQCTTTNAWETIGSVTDIDRLIEAKGMIGGYLPFPTFVTTSYNAAIQKSGSNIQAKTAGYTNTEMTIVLLYTKTTETD